MKTALIVVSVAMAFSLLSGHTSAEVTKPIPAYYAALTTGKIVWWGEGGSLQTGRPKTTNGVIEKNNEMVGDVIAIAARRGNGVAVRQDGTVVMSY